MSQTQPVFTIESNSDSCPQSNTNTQWLEMDSSEGSNLKATESTPNCADAPHDSNISAVEFTTVERSTRFQVAKVIPDDDSRESLFVPSGQRHSSMSHQLSNDNS